MSKHRIIRLLWIFFEKFGLVFLSIFSFFIYAHLLLPEELGQGALVLGVVELITLIFTSTVDSSFVRLDKVSTKQDATLFWAGNLFSLSSMALINIGTFIYTTNPEIRLLMAVASTLLLLQMASRVYVAHMRRSGNFKALAMRTLLGKIVGMAVGIGAAYYGMGAWAIVLQAISMQFIATSMLMMGDKRALPIFIDFKFFRELIVVGAPIALKAVNASILSKGILIVLGIVAGPAAVGYYNMANRLVDLPRSAIYGGIMGYALPVLSRRKHDAANLKGFYTQATLISFLLLAPIFVGLSIFASDVILLIFGEKWRPSIPVLQILSIVAALSFLFLFTSSLLAAMNKAKLTVKAEILSTCVGLVCVYFSGLEYGAVAGALAGFVRLLIVAPANVWALKAVVGYSAGEFFNSFYRSLIACLVMFAGVFTLNIYVPLDGWLHLLLGAPLAGLAYIIVYSIVHRTWLKEIRSFLKSR
mgnify:CR=1 FL=1